VLTMVAAFVLVWVFTWMRSRVKLRLRAS